MSRSVRGGKPISYEYWGRRKGGSYVDRRMSHKMERMQLKEENRVLLNEALFELNEGCYDLTNCVFYRSLFPKAKTIEHYHHLVFGHDVLVVDGVFHGEMNTVEELLAFHYHTGTPYKDIDDLSEKYYEYLKSNNAWDFLP